MIEPELQEVAVAVRSVARAIGRYCLGLAVVCLLLLGALVVRTLSAGAANPQARADTAVVLGAAQYNGRPSPVYQARLDHALALYRAGQVAHLMTLGGNQSGDRTTEGAAGRDYLLDHGVPPADVVGVEVGSDTLTSLQAAAPQLVQRDWGSVVLVTDPAHTYRALVMAEDLGITAIGSPVQTGPAVDGQVQWRYYTREVLGTLFYRLIGGSSNVGGPVL